MMMIFGTSLGREREQNILMSTGVPHEGVKVKQGIELPQVVVEKYVLLIFAQTLFNFTSHCDCR